MNSKVIILLIALYCNNILVGMEIELQYNPILFLKLLDSKEDIKQEIFKYTQTKECWYLKKTLSYNISKKKKNLFSISKVFFDPAGQYFGVMSHNGRQEIHDVYGCGKIPPIQHDEWITLSHNDLSEKLFATILDENVYVNTRKTNATIFSFYDAYSHSLCFNPSGNRLAIISSSEIKIFERYDDYTLEQLKLKHALLTWLLIEKPNKSIDNTFEKFMKDVALKCALNYQKLITIWSTFPQKMQDAIWRTMQYKIQKYGKWIMAKDSDPANFVNDVCRCIIQ